MANFTNRERWLSDRGVTSRRRRYGAFGDLASDQAARGGWLKIANRGGLAYLSRPGTVYYAALSCTSSGMLGSPMTCQPTTGLLSLSAPAGAFRCDGAAFGDTNVSGVWGARACYVRAGDVDTVPPPANAARVATQGQGFAVPEQGGTVYYGAPDVNRWVSRNVPGGLSFMCDNANFGPDPAWDHTKECRLAPHPAVEQGAPLTYSADLAAEQLAEERAVAAVQAARDLAAAQLAIEEQRATEAAEQARVAENAAAQAAAALSAAETYRQIQEEAQRQAAEYAAELATIAAAAGATQLEREALAEMRAEVEALRQATADARATEAERAASYQVAEAVALTEARRQEAAETRLQLAQEAAYTQAALAAGGGAGAGFALEDMLLYGGLALAGVLLLAKGG